MASLVFTDDSGKKYAVAMTEMAAVPAPAPAPAPTPEPTPAPAPAPTSAIPLTQVAPQFSGNTSSGPTNVASGATLLNKTIVASAPSWQSAAVVLNPGGTIKNCVIKSDEAVRIGGNGTFVIDGCWLSAKAVNAGAHADTIQVYDPGCVVDITVRNSLIEAFNENATAGFFAADDAGGKFTFNNVVFKGGPFGARLCSDKAMTVSLKDVYFVGPFGYDPFLFEVVNAPFTCTLWENVRHATIVNGVLVPGNLIPKPF